MPNLAETSKRLLTRCAAWATLFEEVFLCLLLTSMIGLACLQILLRSAFSSGLMWADPLLRYMVLWAGLFGAAAATRHGKHIAIDVASFLLPKKLLPWLHIILNLFAFVVCGFLTYASILFIINEASYAGRGLLNIQSWIYNLAFPLAFALITIRFLVRAVIDGIDLATDAPPAQGEKLPPC